MAAIQLSSRHLKIEKDLTGLINLFDYEQAAKAKISESFFGFYAGGAADEITLQENRTVFNRIKLRPRVLTDVSHRTLETTILGHTTAMPLLIAPTSLAQLAHPAGEVAIAHAAKNAGIIQCVATQSNYSLEEVATAGATNWFQLYVFKDRQLTQHLVERAAAAGYQALVLTVDLPVLGVRDNLIRTGFQLPPELSLKNFDEFHNTHSGRDAAGVHGQLDSSLTWDDLTWLRSISPLPVWVKGILRGDDAKRAVDYGAAGIIVSNHGGRQLDTAVTSIDALPEVVAAAGTQIDVLVDGGIRRGSDIVKALALGARAVLVGRPVLWGLAVAGQEGVERVLSILQREFDTTLALCGCRSVAEIGPDLIVC